MSGQTTPHLSLPPLQNGPKLLLPFHPLLSMNSRTLSYKKHCATTQTSSEFPLQSKSMFSNNSSSLIPTVLSLTLFVEVYEKASGPGPIPDRVFTPTLIGKSVLPHRTHRKQPSSVPPETWKSLRGVGRNLSVVTYYLGCIHHPFMPYPNHTQPTSVLSPTSALVLFWQIA